MVSKTDLGPLAFVISLANTVGVCIRYWLRRLSFDRGDGEGYVRVFNFRV